MHDEGYERYKSIRDMAWDILLQYNIQSLPVDVFRLAQQLEVEVLAYEDGAALVDACGLQEVQAANRAFALYTDRWTVLYNPQGEASLFAIAHELAHIMLKHTMNAQKVGFFTAYYTNYNAEAYTALANEQDANMLASRLLAPACVLRCLRTIDSQQIASLCGLPLPEAFRRAERTVQLIEKETFFTRESEKRVFEQFRCFMEKSPQFEIPDFS